MIVLSVPLIIFSFLSIGLSSITKKSFGQCLPVALMLPMFTLFYSQFLFKSFIPGVVFVIICAVLGFIVWVNRVYHIKTIDIQLKEGLIAFVIVYLAFFLLDFRRPFTTWDELNHWGMMVKEMIRIGRFYSEPVSHLLKHKDYPPFISLYQLFWCIISGRYSGK